MLSRLNISAYIAWRYFFSKKSTNAVNIIAIVAVVGISLVAMAMISVLSVFNGFENFTDGQLSVLSPKYVISREDGKSFSYQSEPRTGISQVVTGQAMARFGENATVVEVLGVDSNFQDVVPMGEFMFEGDFDLGDLEVPTTVIGIGVGSELNAGAGYWAPLELTVPRRTGKISTLFPVKGFKSEKLHITGVFRVDQPEDRSVVFLGIESARQLLDYDLNEVSYLALSNTISEKEALKVSQQLGSEFVLKDRYQQHPEIYRVLKMEKWISFLLLLFVLLLSLFSVISTLGMLIIEKRADAQTLRFLGARQRMIDQVIILEGWLLSIIGLVIGLGVGIVLVLLQDHFGFLKLTSGGSGTFLIDAYPVELRLQDILGVSVVILIIGWLSSLLAFRLFRASSEG